MAEFKRVACLYRVSTKMQLEENDIPMQRNACSEFIRSKPFWKFERDYIERGVSGYHKTEAQRDILQQMKQDAENKVFDILLVFMFDRLGRREDETPFIVEWLVSTGIEVWSVKEGQQKFDNRTDKLLNYIRYWQSGGESEKTSMRVYEAQKQMVEAGKFRGGKPPYGYRVVRTEVVNKKGHLAKTLEIDEQESEVVKLIFKLCCDGWGKRKINMYLNRNGYPPRTAKYWTTSGVHKILTNRVYNGYYVFGKSKADSMGLPKRTNKESWVYSKEQVKDIIIIDDETWEKAHKSRENNRKCSRSRIYQDKTLLLENILRCGYCRCKLRALTKSSREILKCGEERIRVTYAYLCSKRRTEATCDGQQTYGYIKTDKLVLSEIYNYIDKVTDMKINNIADTRKKEAEKQYKSDCSALDKVKQKAESDLLKLNDEIIKCLQGKSKFTDK